MQDKEIWGSVFEDSALHFGVGGVNDSGAKRPGLAFQLEGRITGGTDIVDRGGALWCGRKAR